MEVCYLSDFQSIRMKYGFSYLEIPWKNTVFLGNLSNQELESQRTWSWGPVSATHWMQGYTELHSETLLKFCCSEKGSHDLVQSRFELIM